MRQIVLAIAAGQTIVAMVHARQNAEKTFQPAMQIALTAAMEYVTRISGNILSRAVRIAADVAMGHAVLKHLKIHLIVVRIAVRVETTHVVRQIIKKMRTIVAGIAVLAVMEFVANLPENGRTIAVRIVQDFAVMGYAVRRRGKRKIPVVTIAALTGAGMGSVARRQSIV